MQASGKSNLKEYSRNKANSSLVLQLFMDMIRAVQVVIQNSKYRSWLISGYTLDQTIFFILDWSILGEIIISYKPYVWLFKMKWSVLFCHVASICSKHVCLSLGIPIKVSISLLASKWQIYNYRITISILRITITQSRHFIVVVKICPHRELSINPSSN